MQEDREIKFRAWDKEEKKMIYFDLVGVPHGIIWDADGMRERNIYKKEVMQFTGLKDKNGKEIYEGDIVTESMHFGHRIATYPVRWIESFAAFDPFFDLKDGDAFYANNCEVIGNIYENPDLLKN